MILFFLLLHGKNHVAQMPFKESTVLMEISLLRCLVFVKFVAKFMATP